jgi:hypothetical protein
MAKVHGMTAEALAAITVEDKAAQSAARERMAALVVSGNGGNGEEEDEAEEALDDLDPATRVRGIHPLTSPPTLPLL